jgi:hypothetical protein
VPDLQKVTITGCEEKSSLILEGIEDSRKLTGRALRALETLRSYEIAAIRSNFGSISEEQKATIISRYKRIRSTLDSKTIECLSECEGKKSDNCAVAKCPGNKISLCPLFGGPKCNSGPVILHEAAHNAGACGDIDKDGDYPPRNAENNAYSYEYFALDVAEGPPKPKIEF